jgi:hypothetical protein
MRQKRGRATTKERTVLAGAIMAVLASSAAADSVAPMQIEHNAAGCATDRHGASDSNGGGCPRINGYIAASVDLPPIEAMGGRFSLTRPKSFIPGPDAPAMLDPGFLPAGSDGTR